MVCPRVAGRRLCPQGKPEGRSRGTGRSKDSSGERFRSRRCTYRRALCGLRNQGALRDDHSRRPPPCGLVRLTISTFKIKVRIHISALTRILRDAPTICISTPADTIFECRTSLLPRTFDLAPRRLRPTRAASVLNRANALGFTIIED